jgi:hypothetical protein
LSLETATSVGLVILSSAALRPDAGLESRLHNVWLVCQPVPSHRALNLPFPVDPQTCPSRPFWVVLQPRSCSQYSAFTLSFLRKILALILAFYSFPYLLSFLPILHICVTWSH